MFENASSIIMDPSKLDYEYVPKVLVDRDEQMKTMEVLFRPLAQYGRSCSAFLTGGVGTGKTATAKRFCADMSDYCRSKGKPIEVVFINCRNKSSEAAVILQIIRLFDRGFPERGFSVEEMARVLRTHLMDNSRNLVIVFDEVDYLIRTSGEIRLSNFLLYQLAYAEFYQTDVLWPDFDRHAYEEALLAYTKRNRRFGGV